MFPLLELGVPPYTLDSTLSSTLDSSGLACVFISGTSTGFLSSSLVVGGRSLNVTVCSVSRGLLLEPLTWDGDFLLLRFLLLLSGSVTSISPERNQCVTDYWPSYISLRYQSSVLNWFL